MNDGCIYRHIVTCKLYQRLFDATHTDTKQLVVVYQSINDKRIWVLDADKFNERFEKV